MIQPATAPSPAPTAVVRPGLFSATGAAALVGYVLLGTYFGLVLAKSEAVSWFRIQEMFRFQSFHMYGILGSGVAVAALAMALIRRAGIRSATGEPIVVPDKDRTPGMVRYWAGGTLFGVGWALLGACPGPLYVLVGYGVTVYLVAWLAAVAGAWTYGLLAPRLPH